MAKLNKKLDQAVKASYRLGVMAGEQKIEAKYSRQIYCYKAAIREMLKQIHRIDEWERGARFNMPGLKKILAMAKKAGSQSDINWIYAKIAKFKKEGE